MGLKTPVVNGARQDLPCLDSPEVNGARQSVAAVKKYVDGAWKEIWANTKGLPLLTRTTSTGCHFANEGDWDNFSWLWAVDDSGYIILAVDGEFTDPEISFIFSGGVNYTASDGTNRTAPAATIYTYGVKSDGTVEETNGQTVGSSSGFTDDTAVKFKLSGKYTRIGLKVKFNNWSISPDPTGNPCPYIVFLGSIMINDQKYVTLNEDEYNYNDY